MLETAAPPSAAQPISLPVLGKLLLFSWALWTLSHLLSSSHTLHTRGSCTPTYTHTHCVYAHCIHTHTANLHCSLFMCTHCIYIHIHCIYALHVLYTYCIHTHPLYTDIHQGCHRCQSELGEDIPGCGRSLGVVSRGFWYSGSTALPSPMVPDSRGLLRRTLPGVENSMEIILAL